MGGGGDRGGVHRWPGAGGRWEWGSARLRPQALKQLPTSSLTAGAGADPRAGAQKPATVPKAMGADDVPTPKPCPAVAPDQAAGAVTRPKPGPAATPGPAVGGGTAAGGAWGAALASFPPSASGHAASSVAGVGFWRGARVAKQQIMAAAKAGLQRLTKPCTYLKVFGGAAQRHRRRSAELDHR